MRRRVEGEGYKEEEGEGKGRRQGRRRRGAARVPADSPGSPDANPRECQVSSTYPASACQLGANRSEK